MTDLQADVEIDGDAVSGTLLFVDDYTGFSGDVAKQSGNYLVLHFEDEDADKITVQLIGGEDAAKELDSDGLCIFRITSTTQSIEVKAYVGDRLDTVKTLTLSGLTLNEE